MPRILRLENFQQFSAINVLSDPGAIGGPVQIPSCVQVKLKWSIAGGKTAYNVLYGRVGGVPAPSVAQADAIFTALGTGAQWTALAATLSSTVSFTGVVLKSVHSPGQGEFSSTGAIKAGTEVAQPLPSEVAICTTLKTGFTGPQNRGRMYTTGFTASSLAAGNLVVAATITALGNWANTITGALSAQGYTWVIGQPARAAYTGATGTQHPARAATSVPVSQAVVRDNRWDSQRRRGLR